MDSESDDEPVNKKRETMYESESESDDDGDLTMAGFLRSNRERIEANKHRVARHRFLECDENWNEKMRIIEPSAPVPRTEDSGGEHKNVNEKLIAPSTPESRTKDSRVEPGSANPHVATQNEGVEFLRERCDMFRERLRSRGRRERL